MYNKSILVAERNFSAVPTKLGGQVFALEGYINGQKDRMLLSKETRDGLKFTGL